MAFFDDHKQLIGHLRHAFVTSDDTGMCELILVTEDLDNEIKSDHSFSKRSLRLAQRYSTTADLPTRHAAKSFDIQASPTLSRRPPLKNTTNMFEIAEERRRKKSSQCKTIVWQDDDGGFDPALLLRTDAPARPKPREPSVLAALLAEYDKQTANPFFAYSRFNGENHSIGTTNTYNIFISMCARPTKPVMVTILHNATVGDLIGLTLWKYIELGREPVRFRSANSYAIMIAEEDGDIDIDLPALDREDRVAKFRFRYLGIVETKGRVRLEDVPTAQPKDIVRVYYEQGGFSTLAVENIDQVEMGEVLSKVIKRRRLQIHGYELEKKERPGIAVDLSSTIKSQGTLDFILVKRTGRSATIGAALSSGVGSVDEEDSSDPARVPPELTSHQYKSYRVIMIHKVRANTEVHLGVSAEGVEVDPVGQAKSGIPAFMQSRPKPTTYEIKKICACEVVDVKANNRSVFRIVRVGKDGSYKSLDFETSSATTKEIVLKLNLILEGLSSRATSGYSEWKEQSRGRKGSKIRSD